MPTVKKVSIALTADMLSMIRAVVEAGDYASSSEVVREALRQWKSGRGLVPPSGASDPASASNVLDHHRQAIEQLCRRHGVRRLGVFGSLLRADFDAAKSDIDLTVDFADIPGGSLARQYFDLKSALEQLLGRRVDLVELDAMPDSRLRQRIKRTEVEFFAQAT